MIEIVTGTMMWAEWWYVYNYLYYGDTSNRETVFGINVFSNNNNVFSNGVVGMRKMIKCEVRGD